MSLHTLPNSTAAIEVSLSNVLVGLDALGVSIVVTDLSGTILVWSDSATTLFGWTAEQMLGQEATSVTRWGLSQSDVASILLTGDGEPWSGNADVVIANGDTIRVHMTAALAGQRNDLVLSLARRAVTPSPSSDSDSDSTHPDTAASEDEASQSNQNPDAAAGAAATERGHADELLRMSMYDRLTGLPNRASLSHRIAHSESRHDAMGAGLAVLFVDVDRFKLVNDNRGYATGDALLVAVAHRLTELCPPRYSVARFGDDEFVIVCPNTNADQARRLAERVRRAFDEPCNAGGWLIPVSLSIGIATTDDVALPDLLQSAERALTWAKASGSGRTEVHNQSMRGSTEGRLQLVSDLQNAIKTDALDVHYQPVVRTDGRMAGVEALLRWRHPRRGIVSPEHMVPLAEESGLMPALGALILNRACADIAGLRHKDTSELHVAVNLSSRQLVDANIVDTVRNALSRSGLAAERLVLEVTETSVIENPETTSRHLHALKALGVKLALDDFGTGYSSLMHLRRFPIDIIKIDRSFIAGMHTNKHDFAIVASLTSLARTVGLDVVAEGVETVSQADTLRRLGCAFAQGYLWSPAVPANELAAIARRGLIAEPEALWA